MSVIVKGGGGGKSSGLYVWKKYEVIRPYLAFIGNEDFTLKTYNTAKNWDGTLEYSTDTTTWNTWDGTEISSSGNKLYLRGIGNTIITGNSSNYRFVFTGTNALKIACEGNIETLLDYATVIAGSHPIMSKLCYHAMFYGCTSLTTAPELPSTTLTLSCYNNMFHGCTSLTIAPELPATTLSNFCYSNMFCGCVSLETSPKLPATTLAIGCYEGMFNNCKSLTTAPQLPATTLTDYCYRYMFKYCESLVIAPELSATTLADRCCVGMFYDCTALTTIPKLLSTSLVTFCYCEMFRGCRNLKFSATQTGEYQTPYIIPISGTGITATDALTDMFMNTGGTFTVTPEINTTYYLSTSNTVV